VFLIPQSYEVIEQYRNKENIVNLYKDEDKKAQLRKMLDSLDDSYYSNILNSKGKDRVSHLSYFTEI
jgi:hypothetical protein